MTQTARDPANRPWRPRLQFSLRILLLAFTAFAIGFPIWYRWPYEETEPISFSDDPFAQPVGSTTRTWRRTWGGGKEQSGREVAELVQGKSQSKRIRHYQNGKLHGPCESYLGGKLIQTGQYENGNREGRWVDHDELTGQLICTANWRQDRLDGPYEIVTILSVNRAADRTHLYRFSKGQLIEANGRPIKDRLFEQLAAGSIDERRIAANLRREIQLPMEFIETPLKDALTFLQDAHDLPIVIDMRRVSDIDRPVTLNIRGVDLYSALAMVAAPHDLVFEYRYGVLFLTTGEHASDERDPTGVVDLCSPQGTPLARAWDEPCRLEAVEMPLDAALQQLAQPLAIGFDLSGLPQETQSKPVTLNLRNRSLKHFLGLLLDRLDLRCEARGSDTLVVLPQK